MKRRSFGLLMAILFAANLFIYGCGRSTSSQMPPVSQQQAPAQNSPVSAYQDINPDQLKSMIKENPDLVIIDVREKNEWDNGHLSGSVLIPIGDLQARIGEIPQDKKVVIVCATGARSSAAADYLVQSGYKEVYNLNGGLMSWPDSLVK